MTTSTAIVKAVLEKRIVYVDPDMLAWHPRNPRLHPESLLAKLEKSILSFGWTNPVIVANDGHTILAGHARVVVARRMGISKIPVIKTDLEGDKADAYLLADNRIAEESEWDRPLLKDLFLDLDHGGFDLELTGFDLEEVEELMTAAPPGQGGPEAPAGTGFTTCPECGYTWDRKEGREN